MTVSSAFGIEAHAAVRRKRGENAKVYTLINDATGIELSNLYKYFSGKKKPSLEIVMRIVCAIHPSDDAEATKLIHSAGYDISDARISGNNEFQQMLAETDIDKICLLYYSATKNEKYNPKSGEYKALESFI